MAFGFEFRFSDVGSAAIIRGEDYEGAGGGARGVEGVEDAADGGVCFHDEVCVGQESAFVFPWGIDGERGMGGGEGEVEEEWLGLARCFREEADGAVGQGGQDGFERPVGGGGSLIAGHVISE